jgi:hypothetical protein
MYKFFFIFLALVSSPARATIVEIPANQPFELIGPETTTFQLLSFTATANTGAIMFPAPTDNSFISSYDIEVFANGTEEPVEFCYSSASADQCAEVPAIKSGELIVTRPVTLTEFTYTFHSVYGDATTGPIVSNVPPAGLDVEVDLGLPDGFSIAPVPEPSIWAMLLIGFTCLSCSSWRGRRSIK